MCVRVCFDIIGVRLLHLVLFLGGVEQKLRTKIRTSHLTKLELDQKVELKTTLGPLQKTNKGFPSEIE